MGTNFYARYIPTEEDIKRMHWLIDEKRFSSTWEHEDDPWDSVQNLINFINERVHLCKRSGGWKISWDHNWGKYYQPNRKSLLEFLNNEHYAIEDEYGESFTVETFLKEMDAWDASPNNTMDSAKYRKSQIGKGLRPDYVSAEDQRKCREIFGIEVHENDFTVDGMRWCVFSDFS